MLWKIPFPTDMHLIFQRFLFLHALNFISKAYSGPIYPETMFNYTVLNSHNLCDNLEIKSSLCCWFYRAGIKMHFWLSCSLLGLFSNRDITVWIIKKIVRKGRWLWSTFESWPPRGITCNWSKPSKKLHPFATYAFTVTVTLKMQLTWDSQIIQVMLIHVSMHFAWKGKQKLLPFPRTNVCPAGAELSACTQGTAGAHTTAQERRSCTARGSYCTFWRQQEKPGNETLC